MNRTATVISVVVCNTLLAVLLLGGVGYIVFQLGKSPWWILAVVIIFKFCSTEMVATENGQGEKQ